MMQITQKVNIEKRKGSLGLLKKSRGKGKKTKRRKSYSTSSGSRSDEARKKKKHKENTVGDDPGKKRNASMGNHPENGAECSTKRFCINNQEQRITGPATKLKNLSDVHSVLLGAVGNDFQRMIQKESYEIANDL